MKKWAATRKRAVFAATAVVGLVAIMVGFAGCGADDSTDGGGVTSAGSNATYDGEGPVEVVCTTGMVADMVAAVGGEHVKVTRLMGEGVDPHVYEPLAADDAKLVKADLVFYSGLHLEPGFLRVFKTLSVSKPVVGVADGLEHANEPKLKKLEGEFYDPHVWFDPDLWAKCVPAIVTNLSRFDAENAEDYKKNGDAYVAKVKQLTTYGETRIGSIPEPRVLVTAHDAFSYFGTAFDIEVVAIQGVSTETEAGVGRINELVDLLVDRKVKAVFVESSISDKNIRALIEGAKSRGHDVKLGGELYSDALGKEGTPEGEYLGMVRHNIDTIVQALK